MPSRYAVTAVLRGCATPVRWSRRFRPQTGYYEDVIAEAAALLESLAINHPFVDGNKRVAFAAADVFLRINGWHIQATPLGLHGKLIAHFEFRTFDVAHLKPWLRGVAEEIA